MWCVCRIRERIDPRDLPHVFERFYRSDEAQKSTKGTGLGLYLCKHILDAHGGKIWVDRTYKEGGRICFSLPLGQSPLTYHVNQIELPKGFRLLHLPETGSTNDDCLAKAQQGEPEGLVIVADAQKQGRGLPGTRLVFTAWQLPYLYSFIAFVCFRTDLFCSLHGLRRVSPCDLFEARLWGASAT